jgi:hypothetical protein
MNTTDYIGIAGVVAQLIVAGVAIWAVLSSLRANKDQIDASEKQLKKQIDASDLQLRQQIEESRRLATEERQHQSRPILVPVGEITPVGPSLYESNGIIIWSYQGNITLELQNMGGGVALNVHCILYGSGPMHTDQFVSWDNGPIGNNPIKVQLEHPKQLHLEPKDFIDDGHPLYDTSPTSPSNPTEYRIACLTVTYHDLFEIKHVSIFNYTLEHRWVRVAIEKVPSLNGKPPLDLKELNDQKRQQAPKWSAPPIKTS